jgi:Ca2+-binding EF-hand superfamily protein
MIRFALCLVLASTAGAHSNRLQRLDTNQDGALSLSEALNARHSSFAKLDGNRDAFVQASELAQQAGRAKRLARRFARIDENNDQQISATEWDKPIAKLFAHLDTNNDRQISREEFQQARLRR